MNHHITILGNGNMSFAIASGLSLMYDLEIVGRNIDKLDSFEKKLGIKIKKTLYDDFNGYDKDIILCVKPANLKDIQSFFPAKINTLYSVLAGTNIHQLKQYIDAKHYIRTMPNLAANVQKSMTTLTGDLTCKDNALNIFNAIGDTLWVDSEKELDIATALAGSGPAFLALSAEALADGAVKQGLKRTDAMTLMRGLFLGFGSIIQDIHPALLKDAVMSPGGTTAAGYAQLEKNGARDAFISAVQAAYEKTLK